MKETLPCTEPKSTSLNIIYLYSRATTLTRKGPFQICSGRNWQYWWVRSCSEGQHLITGAEIEGENMIIHLGVCSYYKTLMFILQSSSHSQTNSRCYPKVCTLLKGKRKKRISIFILLIPFSLLKAIAWV